MKRFFVGKFCEKSSKTKTCLVDGWKSLKWKLDDQEINISRIEQLSARTMVLSYKEKEPFITESGMYNPTLAAYTTALARVQLLEKCLEVVGERALYCDTDSICYLKIPGSPEPIRGEALGQLANELKPDEFGTSFQCVAPKTWRLEISKRTCEAPVVWRPVRTLLKSKGKASPESTARMYISLCFRASLGRFGI